KRRLEASVTGSRLGEIAQHEADSRALAFEHAQNVKRHDVAGPLPKAVQGSLTIEPWQETLLYVAVAAQALQRLADDGGRDLAHPVFGDGRHQPTPGCGTLVARSIARCSQPERQRDRRLELERQIGQNSSHQRLVD